MATIPILFSHSLPIWPSSSSSSALTAADDDSGPAKNVGRGSDGLAGVDGGGAKGYGAFAASCLTTGASRGDSLSRPSLCSTRYKRAVSAATCARKPTSSSCKSAIRVNYRTQWASRIGFACAPYQCNQARWYKSGVEKSGSILFYQFTAFSLIRPITAKITAKIFEHAERRMNTG